MLVGFRTSVLPRPTEITASMTSKLWLLNLGCIMLHFFFNYVVCAQPFFLFKRSQVLNSLLETQNNLIYGIFPHHCHTPGFLDEFSATIANLKNVVSQREICQTFSNQFRFFHFLECDTFFTL